MNLPANQVVVVQTVAKAAAKTFIQTFVVTVAPLLLAWIGSQQLALSNAQTGGNVDINFSPLPAILVGGLMAAVAALISAAWNLAKGPTTTTPVTVQPPVFVDK